MLVYAIVVTYNGMRWYDRCFGSLRISEQKVSTIVVDNLSTDGTVEYIKRKYPEVHIIESDENFGFAKANNIGIRYAIDHNADFVFLLNQDAWVENNTLSELLNTFSENKNVGIASPIHLNGTYTGLDWGFIHCMDGFFISDAFLKKTKHYYEVPHVNAAAWLICSECIRKVGGFDTSLFFHYGEDDNYSQRIIFHGFKTVVNTFCTICHDREFRKEHEAEYRSKMMERNPNIRDKIKYGNVNIEYDLNELIRIEKVAIIYSIIRLSPKRYKLHSSRINTLREIVSSREINRRAGENWLNDYF